MTLLRSLDREQKIFGGVLAALGILMFVFVGVSRDASGSAKPIFTNPPAATREHTGTGDQARKADPTPAARPARDKASTPDPRSSADRHTQPASHAEASRQTRQPAASEAKESEGTASPRGRETTPNPLVKSEPDKSKSQPDKSVARVRPEAKPTPSPELTGAQVRSLPAHATLASAVAALGQPLTTAELRGKYGAPPIQLLLGQQPAGSACRYYGLAPGEPAPLVRLCFGANGSLLTREFVAPPPKA